MEHMLGRYGLSHPREILPWLQGMQSTSVVDLEDDPQAERAARDLRSPLGRMRFTLAVGGYDKRTTHPMLVALRQADAVLQLGTEISHPLEQDNRDLEQQFMSVVTVRSVASAGLALSPGDLPLHQDGMGTAGSVRFISMCLDSGPATGGGQLYSNLLAEGLWLANTRWDRFVEATQVDAISVTRFAGSRAMSVTGPLFYVDGTGLAAAHYRADGGEYTVKASDAVSSWLGDFRQSLAAHSRSEKIAPGDCLVVDNLAMAHARSAFADGKDSVRDCQGSGTRSRPQGRTFGIAPASYWTLPSTSDRGNPRGSRWWLSLVTG